MYIYTEKFENLCVILRKRYGEIQTQIGQQLDHDNWMILLKIDWKPAVNNNKPSHYRHKCRIKTKNRRILLKCLNFYRLTTSNIQSAFGLNTCFFVFFFNLSFVAYFLKKWKPHWKIKVCFFPTQYKVFIGLTLIVIYKHICITLEIWNWFCIVQYLLQTINT